MEINTGLRRIDQLVVWLLLALFYIMTLSGYMLTKGFIDRYWGFVAHLEFAIPTMAVFAVHFAIRLRFMLVRRQMKGLIANVVSIMAGAVLFMPILYLDLFFRLG